ncbi:MAG: Rieske (2Fe-2S) iron-sulfur domain protein [Planctomycetaceae bacterium]|nr:Rieske (2Fe-2S) iron-sulfur domain protein [Planctomycetaceae bacterium]
MRRIRRVQYLCRIRTESLQNTDDSRKGAKRKIEFQPVTRPLCALAPLREIFLPDSMKPMGLLEGSVMSEWLRIAAVDEIPVGTGKEFVAGGQIVAIYHVGGEFRALDGICPHAGGPLAEGKLNGTTVTCPWHGRQFDVTNGHDCLIPNQTQPCFSVKVEGADVWIEIP